MDASWEPVIRPARRGDAEALVVLWRALLDEQAALDDRFRPADDAAQRWRNDFPVWLDDGTCRLFVVPEGEVLAGYVRAHRFAPPPVYAETSEVFVDELYVARAARRRGLGTRLVAAVRAWAEEVGAQRLRLSMLTANGDGRAFWSRVGARTFSETLTMELERERRSPVEHGGRLGF